MEKRIAIRNEAGQFCSVSQWFKEHDGRYCIGETTTSYHMAETRLQGMLAEYADFLTVAEIAIATGRNIIHSGASNNVSLRVEYDGDVTIYTQGRTTGEFFDNRADIFNALRQALDTLIEQQRQYAAAALAMDFEALA